MIPTILGLDVGTTAAKAVLFDLHGNELALAERAYPLITPHPGWAELDPERIWLAAQDVISEVTSQNQGASFISAVGLSTQGGTLIPADKDGNPVYNAITWLDQRSTPIITEWQAQGLDRWVRQKSGWTPQPGLPLASLAALRSLQPETFAKIGKVFSVNDYLAFKMTGTRCTNPSMAGEMLLVNLESGQYDLELCELAGIHPDMLSPIQPSNSTCAQIKPDLCNIMGLPPKTPLINGGQDHACEALALGMNEPGATLLACGTAWVINTVTDSTKLVSIPPEMALNNHVLPNHWIASQFLGGFGAGFSWWLDHFSKAENIVEDRYFEFDSTLSPNNKHNSDIYYFSVSGTPRSGITAGGFWGLRLDHTRDDLTMAVLESAAFEVSLALEDLHQHSKHISDLWMVGGAAHSRIWPQILADTTQLPILLTQYHHGPALGAVILAGLAQKQFNKVPTWIIPTVVQPDTRAEEIIREKREIYQSLLNKFTK